MSELCTDKCPACGRFVPDSDAEPGPFHGHYQGIVTKFCDEDCFDKVGDPPEPHRGQAD